MNDSRRPKDTLGITSITGSDSDDYDSEDHLAPHFYSQDAQSLSRIFTDAADFHQVLLEKRPSTDSHTSTSSNDKPIHKHGDAFIELVGKDLDVQDDPLRSYANLARLNTASDGWAHEKLLDEPSSYEGDTSGSSTPSEFSQEDNSLSEGEEKPKEDWKLPSHEVLALIQEGCGVLTVGDETEELLIEADSAVYRDVLILGVIHLTTHRLSFHASLLSTRPDYLASEQILKAGTCTIVKKGIRRNRRVWLELSHDMLCVFPSSDQKDHIRPLWSIILSSIKEIHPVDPKHPTRILLSFDVTAKKTGTIIEVDTEEMAAAWRRDISGAVFVYRHSRQEMLSPKDVDDEHPGIRLSVPLTRIQNFTFEPCLDFAQLLILDINYTIPMQVVLIREDPVWEKLGEYITAAKERSARAIAVPEALNEIFADLGPLQREERNSGDWIDHLAQGDTEWEVRRALGLHNESNVWVTTARIDRQFHTSGWLAISEHYFGFWSKQTTSADIYYRIPLREIKFATQYSPTKLIHASAIRLEIEGIEDLKFHLKSDAVRDEALSVINENVAVLHSQIHSPSPHASAPPTPSTDSEQERHIVSSPTQTQTPASPPHRRSTTELIAPLERTLSFVSKKTVPHEVRMQLPKPINLPAGIAFAPKPSMHFVCLTIGSRGDVQPYIALGLGLLKDGHKVTIVTHEEYKAWIESYPGLKHRTAGGDPGALMKLSVENKMFSPEFFKESITNFRPWLNELLAESWIRCQDADVLLESPSAMAGVHIAEARNIPYFRCFTMPWTKTTSFPHAFLSPPVENPAFNAASYVLFANVMWAATSGQINRWRRETLNLPNTDMGYAAQANITFIYNFSPAVVPKPLDWGDRITVSGYWFLDNPDQDWTPPESLVAWIAKAREDKKPIVYIGFGSITVPNPHKMTENIVKAVLKSGVRAIISRGWSARMSKNKQPEVEMPPECYRLDKVPHDWLFPQIDAALHHGGAGTTGASLRAGITTLIKPWFGDQFFWANRVERLGAGLRVPSLRVDDLASCLTRATSSRLMKERASIVGQKIRSEDGVQTAIYSIYTWLPRAIMDRQQKLMPTHPNLSAATTALPSSPSVFSSSFQSGPLTIASPPSSTPASPFTSAAPTPSC